MESDMDNMITLMTFEGYQENNQIPADFFTNLDFNCNENLSTNLMFPTAEEEVVDVRSWPNVQDIDNDFVLESLSSHDTAVYSEICRLLGSATTNTGSDGGVSFTLTPDTTLNTEDDSSEVQVSQNNLIAQSPETIAVTTLTFVDLLEPHDDYDYESIYIGEVMASSHGCDAWYLEPENKTTADETPAKIIENVFAVTENLEQSSNIDQPQLSTLTPEDNSQNNITDATVDQNVEQTDSSESFPKSKSSRNVDENESSCKNVEDAVTPTQSNGPPFACPTCGKCFNQRSRVIRHMRSHDGEKPFPCTVCNKWFAYEDSVKRHAVIHTGNKPFPCLDCGKLFAQKWTLNVHKRIHSNVRPYTCDQCPQTFTISNDLRRHRLIHTGLRPYQCVVCKLSFNRRHHMTDHVKSQHKYFKIVGKQTQSAGENTELLVKASRRTAKTTYKRRKSKHATHQTIVPPRHDEDLKGRRKPRKQKSGGCRR